MDEVMADTLGEYLTRYNQTFNDNLRPDDLAGKDVWNVTPADRFHKARSFFDSEEFFDVLPVIPGAQDVLEKLSAHYEIYVATQAMVLPHSLGPKYRWLRRHFPFIPISNYVFCGDKSILLADYLIDDLPYNIERFRGAGLLYYAPHNALATGFTRVANWREVAAYFERKL
jgi:5'-nucleotidase